ncbi:hypothetical protein [Geopseudomonas aromaticivorans]
MDLFGNENPRLQLAPVRAFNRFLLESFGKGACTCHRCRESGNVEDGYAQAHTFDIDGKVYARRFACTADTDVMGALEGGWKSFYKTAMPARGAVDLPGIHEFTDAESRPFLLPLLIGAQCAHEHDGTLLFGLPKRAPASRPPVVAARAPSEGQDAQAFLDDLFAE